MKKIIFYLLIILPLLFIKIPKYRELNNIIIIDKIELSCNNNSNNKYFVRLRETIPKKDDNGINYEYKYYSLRGNNFDEIINDFSRNGKYIYYKKYKKFITDCTDDEVLYFFNKKTN